MGAAIGMMACGVLIAVSSIFVDLNNPESGQMIKNVLTLCGGTTAILGIPTAVLLNIYKVFGKKAAARYEKLAEIAQINLESLNEEEKI